MHDQRNLTQDAVLRAQIAMANRLIAEQSATIARAHSAIERAMETLRGPDGEGPTKGRCEVADAQARESSEDVIAVTSSLHSAAVRRVT
jgi:hypothetical protein